MTLFTPEMNALFDNAAPQPAVKSDQQVPLFTPEIDKAFKRTTTSAKAQVNPAVAAYDRLNPYEKVLRAADDMVRLFSTGATYGAIDALSPEQAQLTEQARQRFPVAGAVSEFGGALASPITGAIGAGAKALMPVGRGLANMLGRAAVTSGEGAAIGGTGALLSGRPQDTLHDMGIGAVLPHAIGLAGKGMSVPLKYVSSFMANRSAAPYGTAFNVGRYGSPEEMTAYKAGLAKKGPPSAKPSREERAAYNAGRSLAQWRPSSRSIFSMLSGPGSYAIHPGMLGLNALAIGMGSPRLGGAIAHGIGSVLGGLDMAGSKAAVPTLAYEQYRRRYRQ